MPDSRPRTHHRANDPQPPRLHGALVAVLAAGLPALLVAAVIWQPYVDPRLLFMDPVVAGQMSGDCCRTYFGWLSTLGVMMWTAAAAVSGFAALVMWLKGHENRRQVLAAACAFLLTGLLAVDDAFLLHERVFPAFGIAQSAMLATYVVLALLYAALAHSLRQTRDLTFLAAGGFLAASLAIDAGLQEAWPLGIALEDGSKLIGISCWMVFHFGAALRLVCADVTRAQTPVPFDSIRRRLRLPASAAPLAPALGGSI